MEPDDLLEATPAEEVTPAESEAAFEAGFKGTREVESDDKPEDKPDEEPSAVADPVVEQTDLDDDGSANQEAFPGIGLTSEQMRETLSKVGKLEGMSKQIDRLFGTLGDMQQKMTQVQPITKDEKALVKQEFSRTREEYPELAVILAEDMKDVMASKSPIDIDGAVNQRLAEKMGEIQDAFEIKLLNMQHKDWQEQVTSTDFSLWLQTLPDQQRKDVLASSDSAVVVDAVSNFKIWKSNTIKRSGNTQRNQKRLEDAIVPKGTARNQPVTQSDEDAFVSGFKGARGQ